MFIRHAGSGEGLRLDVGYIAASFYHAYDHIKDFPREPLFPYVKMDFKKLPVMLEKYDILRKELQDLACQSQAHGSLR